MTLNDFKTVGKELHTKSAWTDGELLQAIQVHQCLVTYFCERGEPLISFSLKMELNSLESYAFHRGWKENEDGTWQIRRKDGTFT